MPGARKILCGALRDELLAATEDDMIFFRRFSMKIRRFLAFSRRRRHDVYAAHYYYGQQRYRHTFHATRHYYGDDILPPLSFMACGCRAAIYREKRLLPLPPI